MQSWLIDKVVFNAASGDIRVINFWCQRGYSLKCTYSTSKFAIYIQHWYFSHITAKTNIISQCKHGKDKNLEDETIMLAHNVNNTRKTKISKGRRKSISQKINRHEFEPEFVPYKNGFRLTRIARDNVCQLLVPGRWFSPVTPASSTRKLTTAIWLKYWWKWR